MPDTLSVAHSLTALPADTTTVVGDTVRPVGATLTAVRQSVEADTALAQEPSITANESIGIERDSFAVSVNTSLGNEYGVPRVSDSAYSPEETGHEASSIAIDSVKDSVYSLYDQPTFLPEDRAYETLQGCNHHGVEGELLPYNVSSDNVVTALLLLSMLITTVCLSHSRRFIARQTKSFFYTPHGQTSTVTETCKEIVAQLLLVVQTCLTLSIVVFIFIEASEQDSNILPSPYRLIWIFFGGFIVYYVLKALLYVTVNGTLFEKKENEAFMKALLFISGIEGVALMPAILLQLYFEVTVENTVVFALIVVVLGKLLTLYRTFSLFFKRRGGVLQVILYFCALEMSPPLFFWGVMAMVVDRVRIGV